MLCVDCSLGIANSLIDCVISYGFSPIIGTVIYRLVLFNLADKGFLGLLLGFSFGFESEDMVGMDSCLYDPEDVVGRIYVWALLSHFVDIVLKGQYKMNYVKQLSLYLTNDHTLM